jgi:hypothetical protein
MAQQTASCLHPINRREPYRLGLYKCHECGNIIFEEYKSNSSQQTAVEKLESTIQSMIEHGADLGEDYPALMVHIQQAKETEKQQHSETWHDSRENTCIPFEDYYTKTYGK